MTAQFAKPLSERDLGFLAPIREIMGSICISKSSTVEVESNFCLWLRTRTITHLTIDPSCSVGVGMLVWVGRRSDSPAYFLRAVAGRWGEYIA